MDNAGLNDDLAHGFLDESSYVVNSEALDDENNSDSYTYKNAPLREQDRFLPIANVAKIMKRAIPDNGKIAKDARECVQECISEFISFITSEAIDRCTLEKRKTINGEDILFAMSALGFDNYIEPLKTYLRKYREMVLSPVTVQKMSNKVVIYEDQSYPTKVEASTAQAGEEADEATVIYTYPKVIGEFTLG